MHDSVLLSLFHLLLLHVLCVLRFVLFLLVRQEKRTHPIYSFHPSSFLFSLFLPSIFISHTFFSLSYHVIFHDL